MNGVLVLSDWININEQMPPEDKAVLAYTEEGIMKVVKLRHGVFDTYMKVIGWQFLPHDKPNFIENIKKRNMVDRRNKI